MKDETHTLSFFFLFFLRGYKPKIQTHVARTTANNKNCMGTIT